MNTIFVSSLLQIAAVNIVLSGDNAVVIAMAARNLAPKFQKLAILLGCGGAIVLRIALTLAAVEIMKIPFLQLVGALLLVWIAIKLLVEDSEEIAQRETRGNLLSAAKTIVIADVLMSLDNTLAIAGIANGDPMLVVIGLSISIPLIIFGSTVIIRLIDSFPVIVYIGAGLIAWTAGAMIGSDAAFHPYMSSLGIEELYLAAFLAMTVVCFGWWYNRRKRRTAKDVLIADKRAAQRIDDQID